MIDKPDVPDQDDSLAAMLCHALDGAAADPVRLHLLTALFLMTHDTSRSCDAAYLARRSLNAASTRTGGSVVVLSLFMLRVLS